MKPSLPLASAVLLFTAACGPLLGDAKKSTRVERSSANDDIPGDPGGAPPEPTKNDLKPAFSLQSTPDNDQRIRLNLAGLIDKATGKAIEFKANETVFVQEDGELRGLKVSQAQQSNQLPYDVVFVVDNSGSMDEEANTVTDRIVDFAEVLGKSGLDVRLGVVGFDGNPNGGIDLTDAAAVKAFLTRTGVTGTSRTKGFDGANKADLEKAAGELDAPYGENGVVAIRFAHGAFNYRANAQKVFLYFTDEPNQDSATPHTAWRGYTDYHAAAFCAGWQPGEGVVHVVWSGYATTTFTKDEEDPRSLADCTGGTKVDVASDAKDLDLTKLDVTKALASSALVEYVSADPSQPHEVTVTVKNGDSADGRLTQSNVKYQGAPK